MFKQTSTQFKDHNVEFELALLYINKTFKKHKHY